MTIALDRTLPDAAVSTEGGVSQVDLSQVDLSQVDLS